MTDVVSPRGLDESALVQRTRQSSPVSDSELLKSLGLEGACEIALGPGRPKEEWLAVRRERAAHGFSGTEVSIVNGSNPWESQRDLQAKKRALRNGEAVAEVPPTLPMAIGTHFEPFLTERFREYAAETLKLELATEVPKLLVTKSPRGLDLLASLDGLLLDPETGKAVAVVEYKTTRKDSGWENGAIPRAYQAQAAMYCIVTGLREVHFYCLNVASCNEFHAVYRPSEEFLRETVALLDAWWVDYIDETNEPQASRSELNEIVPEAGSVTVASPADVDRIEVLVGLKEQRNALDTRIKDLEAAITAAIGNAAELANAAGEVLATFKSSSRTTIDGKGLAEAAEAAGLDVAPFKKTATFRTLRIRQS